MGIVVTDWRGLYAQGWGADLVLDAFSHPAKVRPALSRKIFEHAIEEGWLAPGSIVLDPFAGIAGFALSAMRYGMVFFGVELEEKFVELGNQNIALWNQRYSALPGWGSAVLLQGDSRELAQVVEEAGCAISSPPFQSSLGKGGETKGFHSYDKNESYNRCKRDYINPITPGQLANLPEGDYAAACISSPPYAGGCQHTGGDDPKPEHVQGGTYHGVGISGAISSPPYAESLGSGKSGIDWSKQADRDTAHPHGWNGENYGHTPGQLGQMRDGGFSGAVSSPPYAAIAPAKNSTGVDLERQYETYRAQGGGASFQAFCDTQRKHSADYGHTPGQLGQESGDTFWSAARIIVEQLYHVLRPGAAAIWVVKAFVRDGERVDFPGQWRELCEAVGFRTLHKHRAWLVEDRGAQYDIFGELHERQVHRKSFFRRLAESKGSPPIDYEVVWCMQK